MRPKAPRCAARLERVPVWLILPLIRRMPPAYSGCQLHTDGADDVAVMTLGPHCQCRAVEEARRLDPGGGGALVRRMAVRGREINVPRWVWAASANAARNHAHAYWEPRVQVRSRIQPPPAGGHNARMFRSVFRAGCSRCQVLRAVYNVQSDMDQALRAGADFAKHLHEEMHLLVLGRVGTNEGMSSLLRDVSTCWDWEKLLDQAPSSDHVRAFQRVCQQLLHLLRASLWPGSAVFLSVPRVWPQIQEASVQYVCGAAGQAR